MNFLISYKQNLKNGKWSYKKNKIVSEDELDAILSDPDCILINGSRLLDCLI